MSSVNVSDYDPIAEKFRRFILAELNRRFINIEKVPSIAIATILDPRFKKTYFNDRVAVSSALNRISHEMKQIIRTEANEAVASVTQIETEDATEENSEDLWQIHKANMMRSVAVSADEISEGHPVELRQYLNKPITAITTNPLETWENMKVEFPHLYIIARQYLSIIATSVPAERLFSEAGLIITDKRSRLTGEHLSQLIFLSSVSENFWVTATNKM